MKTKTINLYKMNSLLFVPAIKNKFYKKIFNLKGINKPDGIIFDLEDSVNLNSKERARKILLGFVRESNNREILCREYLFLVRINPISSFFFKDDIRLIKDVKPDILMLSKVETAEEVKNYKKYHNRLFVVVETLKGIFNLQKILEELRKTDMFAIGYEDLSAELLIERPANLNSFNPITFILLKAFITTRGFGIPMFDAVFRGFKTKLDLLQLKNECQYTAGLGLVGKVAIHPNQIKIINSIFSTKKKRLLQRSRDIVANFNKITDGSFVLVDEQKQMLDTPSYKLAQEIIKKYG